MLVNKKIWVRNIVLVNKEYVSAKNRFREWTRGLSSAQLLKLKHYRVLKLLNGGKQCINSSKKLSVWGNCKRRPGLPVWRINSQGTSIWSRLFTSKYKKVITVIGTITSHVEQTIRLSIVMEYLSHKKGWEGVIWLATSCDKVSHSCSFHSVYSRETQVVA
jgi:hypothetical protein